MKLTKIATILLASLVAFSPLNSLAAPQKTKSVATQKKSN